MCTVTFMPFSNTDFVITNNRDEAPGRGTLPPRFYTANGGRLLYPKDEVAGGTWVGVSDKARYICLMNGGFVPHERKKNYRKSRGIVVTDLLAVEKAEPTIKKYDFNGIEPFTIVMVEWGSSLQLFELVWDGTQIHFTVKPLKPTIWSSSLLYPKAVKEKRENWFDLFLKENPIASKEGLLRFHKTAGEGNKETNIIMDQGFVKTKSIAQTEKKENKGTMRYEDLETGEVSIQTF